MAFVFQGSAACESTAPTEKPTRLRAGMVIWSPPRMDLTLRATTLRRFQVPITDMLPPTLGQFHEMGEFP